MQQSMAQRSSGDPDLCDFSVGALREMGYDVNKPEGTFYLLVRSPLADEQAFCARLAARKVLVLPGSAFEMPGYFRLSLTANADMIERGLPHFETAIREALGLGAPATGTR